MSEDRTPYRHGPTAPGRRLQTQRIIGLATRLAISVRGETVQETLWLRAGFFAILYWNIRQRWDWATDPGPIPTTLRTIEVATGRVTIYAIPPRLRPLIALKGQARRVRR